MLPATTDQKARGWSPFLRAIADQPTTLNGRSSGSTMGSAGAVLMAYNGQRSWWDGRCRLLRTPSYDVSRLHHASTHPRPTLSVPKGPFTLLMTTRRATENRLSGRLRSAKWLGSCGRHHRAGSRGFITSLRP